MHDDSFMGYRDVEDDEATKVMTVCLSDQQHTCHPSRTTQISMQRLMTWFDDFFLFENKKTSTPGPAKQLRSQTPLRTAWPTVRGGWGERGDVRRRDDRPAVRVSRRPGRPRRVGCDGRVEYHRC